MMNYDRPTCPPLTRCRVAAQSGFSLLEMMVVVALLIIIGMAATTSFSGNVAGYRILKQADSLSRDFQYARLEATKRGQFVTVCATSDGATCNGTSSWIQGWLVFVDPSATGTYTGSTGQVLLRAETQSPGKNTMTINGVPAASLPFANVIFNRQGSISGLAGNPVTMILHDPNSQGALTRCVTLSPSGRTAVQNSGVGACS